MSWYSSQLPTDQLPGQPQMGHICLHLECLFGARAAGANFRLLTNQNRIVNADPMSLFQSVAQAGNGYLENHRAWLSLSLIEEDNCQVSKRLIRIHIAVPYITIEDLGKDTENMVGDFRKDYDNLMYTVQTTLLKLKMINLLPTIAQVIFEPLRLDGSIRLELIQEEGWKIKSHLIDTDQKSLFQEVLTWNPSKQEWE